MQEGITKNLIALIDLIAEMTGFKIKPSEYCEVALIPPVVLILQLIEATSGSANNVTATFQNMQLPFDPLKKFYLILEVKMKINYENLEYIYLTRKGNFKDKRTNKNFKESNNVCPICGETFLIRLDEQNTIYCSYTCLGIGRKHNIKEEEKRKCKQCDETKDITEFRKCRSYKGRQSYLHTCYDCYKSNGHKQIPEAKEIVKKNKPIKITDSEKVIRIKLSNNFAARIRNAIKKDLDGSWISFMPYDIKELKEHIENQFLPGMSWDNYNHETWHIDHILPVSSFTFSSYIDEEFQKCWSLKNLQPLWALDNLKKSNKIIVE